MCFQQPDACAAVLQGDAGRMGDVLDRMLVQGSCWNLTDEMSCEQILMTILYGISGHCRIRTEEEGNGRADIIMEPRRQGLPNVIWELKKVDSEEKLAEAALEQIRDRRCHLGMEGTVLLYGIAFLENIPCMKHDRLELPEMHRIS